MPVMPIEEYAPFSPEEKAQIIARHKELVDKFNERLPFGKKLRVDENLSKKLDNPETIALYRIGQKAHELHQKQAAIHKQMENKFGKVTESNCMSRSLVYAFDTSGTEEAKKYNEKLYCAFKENPDKVVFERYKKVLDFNPREIFDCRDNKQKMAEFYLKNYPLCEEAFVFSSAVGNSNKTGAMKSAIESMKKPLEVLAYPQSFINAAHDLDYFAFPEMDAKQSEIIQLQGGELMANISPVLQTRLNNALEEDNMDKPWKYFGKLQIHGVELEKGTFLKNKPVEKIEQNGQTVYKEVSYDKLIANKDHNVELQKRSEKEIFEVRCMNKSFQAEYLKKWRQNFQKRTGFPGDFDMNAIEERHKGGFFERNILHSTSQQYKDMIQAMKDYNDPKSKYYCDRAHLKDKACDYVERKHGQGYESLDQMKGTSKIRTELALNIIASCDEPVDFDGIEQDWFKNNEAEAAAVPDKESFLKAEDVKEQPVVEEKAKDEPEKEVAIQQDLGEKEL